MALKPKLATKAKATHNLWMCSIQHMVVVHCLPFILCHDYHCCKIYCRNELVTSRNSDEFNLIHTVTPPTRRERLRGVSSRRRRRCWLSIIYASHSLGFHEALFILTVVKIHEIYWKHTCDN